MGFKDAWKRAGEPADDFDPPDGPHKVRVFDGGAWTTNDGREFAKATLEITEGEHKGRRFDDFMNFNNDVGARRARENLSLYGVKAEEIEDLEDLDTAIIERIGTTATVEVKHSADGRFLNVSVLTAETGESDLPGQETFETGDPVGATRTGRPADDDDIPF